MAHFSLVLVGGPGVMGLDEVEATDSNVDGAPDEDDEVESEISKVDGVEFAVVNDDDDLDAWEEADVVSDV